MDNATEWHANKATRLMPRFEIEQNGKRFEVEAPDMDAATTAIGSLPSSAAPGVPETVPANNQPSQLDPRIRRALEALNLPTIPTLAMSPEFVDRLMAPLTATKTIMEASRRGAPGEAEMQTMAPAGLTVATTAIPAVPGGRLPTAPRPMVSLNPSTAAASRIGKAALEDAETRAGIDTTPNLGRTLFMPPPEAISPRQLAADAAKLIREGLSADQDLRMFDVGGESTLGETRRAADMSSRAQANMSPFAEERWKQQGSRIAEWMRKRMGNPREAHLELDLIRENAKDPKSKAYQAALTAGQRNPDFNPKIKPSAANNPGGIQPTLDLLSIMNDESMLPYIKKGERRYELARNADLTVDKGSVQPLKNGMLNPNIRLPLDFWDYVKRAIDDGITSARREAPTEALMLGTIREQLIKELDRQVPLYKDARGVAAAAFKAGDAVEAGIMIAKDSKILRSEIDKVRAKTPPEEWGRVQIGFYTEWMKDALRVGDRQDILRRIAKNPIERDKIKAVLGDGVAEDLEGVMFREDLMQKAYRALRGGSMSPRRQARMHTPSFAPSAAISGAALLVTQHVSSLIVPALLYGVRRAEMAFQLRVAEEVADKLVSQNPNVYMEGIYEARPFLPNLRKWILAGAPLAISENRPTEPGIDDRNAR